MAADRRRYNRTIDGNVAYDLNYQKTRCLCRMGDSPIPNSPVGRDGPAAEKLRAAG